MFRLFADVLDWLNRTTDYERQTARYSPGTYNLERMRRLAGALGNPERRFPSLHSAGYRTGLYTSPHLVDMRERIRLNGVPIGERELVWAMNRMEPALRRLRPTYFETMTAAAFLLFAKKKVDYAVVEVGLGGRLDATNI